MADTEYHRNRKRERRQRYVDLLGGECERCGSKTDLHFDHKNPAKKEFHISRMINAPEDVVLKEVKKCRLLCNDCHREKTRENWEFGADESEHGTLWRYKKYKCRCDKCRDAMSNYYHSRTASVTSLEKIAAIVHPTRDLRGLLQFRSLKIIKILNEIIGICDVVLKMNGEDRDDYLKSFFGYSIGEQEIRWVRSRCSEFKKNVNDRQEDMKMNISNATLIYSFETLLKYNGADFKELSRSMEKFQDPAIQEEYGWDPSTGQDAALATAILTIPKLWSDVVIVLDDMATSLANTETARSHHDKQPKSESIETLYHATANIDRILANGFTSDPVKTEGLGGSTSLKAGGNGVSFTSDLYVAKEIARCFKELIMIATGELTGPQLLNWMDDELKNLVLRGSREIHGTKSIDTPEDVVNIYKVYLAHSKRYDPLFMPNAQNLVSIFGSRQKENVGIIQAQIDMNNPNITYFSGMHEYRVPPEAVLSIDGAI